MAKAEEVKAKVEEATVVAKAEEAKAEARVGAMTVVATPVGTTAWLSSFFYKRACNSAKGTEQSSNTRDPLVQNTFATVSEFRRGMAFEQL